MKRIYNIFISIPFALILLALYAIVTATGTFIENKYNLSFANQVVYNTWWFSLIHLLFVMVMIGNVFRYKLYKKNKLAVLIFHGALIVMIIGAGFTRYTGFEGRLHLSEGEIKNKIRVGDSFLHIDFGADNETKSFTDEIFISAYKEPEFNKTYTVNGKDFTVELKRIIPNPEQSLVNASDGKDMLEMLFITEGEMQRYLLREKARVKVNNLDIGFKSDAKNITGFTFENDTLYLESPHQVNLRLRNGDLISSIQPHIKFAVQSHQLYEINEERFVISRLLKKVKYSYGKDKNIKGFTFVSLLFEIKNGNSSKQIEVLSSHSTIGIPTLFDFGGQKIRMSFGEKEIGIPFSVKLNDFKLEYYPGSRNPSNAESDIEIIDNRINLHEKHSLAKNKVVNYDGYRLFQSSFDNDEKGTQLSVNYDFWGTLISYIGYILLGIGSILILFNKKSYFSDLDNKIKKVRNKRKSLLLLIILLLFINNTSYSQPSTLKSVSEGHAEYFGTVIVQTFDGRMCPVHTYATDVVHKITRKDNFFFKEKGEMNAMQLYLDFLLEPEYWKQQKIIYVGEKSLRDILGMQSKYTSYNSFFEKNNYKLNDLIQVAFRKKEADQSRFDREVLKVTERLNIFIQTTQGSQLNIFPEIEAQNNNWISWTDSLANKPLKGAIETLNKELKMTNFNYRSFMLTYLNSLRMALNHDNYETPDRIINYIKNIQRNFTDKNLLPSERNINFEIKYNELNIFMSLKYIYAILSVVFLFVAFTDSFRTKSSKLVKLLINICVVLVGIAFLYHTVGLAMRWYISGHAPWSTGYEVLLLVSWACVLAGFTTIRYSKITLAATSLLAFILLMTAGHSFYDPQLTNLVPELQSVWLIIHVAIITIGYGFLAAGFLLGLTNVCIFLLTKKNDKVKHLVFEELTYINQKLITIGLLLSVIGTFIGSIWANEAWGGYWTWNAKLSWSLIIILIYGILLHFRLIPRLKSFLIFNIGAVLSFGTVLMTFVGVNYFFTKGLHSYATDDPPIFPIWAWILIILILILIIASLWKEKLKKSSFIHN